MVSCFGENLTSQVEIALFAESFAFFFFFGSKQFIEYQVPKGMS